MKKQKQYKKASFVAICFVVALFAISLSVMEYFQIQEKVDDTNSTSLDMIDQRMQNVTTRINSFPSSAADEILVLSRFSCFKEYIGASKAEKEKISWRIEHDFLEFLKQSPAYYQLRYIDENGQELVRVDHDGEGDYKVIQKDKLQNKKDRYYFQEAMQLKEGGVFISQLDLNIENGQIENRGTKEFPVHVPVIRYAIGVFDASGNRKGIVVANIYANYFLDDIRDMQRNKDAVVLINQDGYYLAHPDKEKEYGFMLGNDYNFFTDYPDVANKIFSDKENVRAITDEWIATYKYINPQETSFEIFQGARDKVDDYYWILIDLTPKKDVYKSFSAYLSNYLSFILLNFGFLLIIISLVYLIGFKAKK